jgi:hypothetical protein
MKNFTCPLIGIVREKLINVRPIFGLTRLFTLRLLHMMNVRFGLLNMAQRILGVTLPNF